MENKNAYYIGVHYQNSEKPYCFSTEYDDFKLDDMVVVDTPNGTEIAFVCLLAKPLSAYGGKLALKPILRKATKSDISNFKYNAQSAERAIGITQDGIAKLNLPNKPFSRATPKVGRNDPCPCGSGKKYKNCCGKNA